MSKKQKKFQSVALELFDFCDGAEGRGRTDMLARAHDFEIYKYCNSLSINFQTVHISRLSKVE